jgi:hypothetical protein
MPQTLNPKEKLALTLLIEHAGQKNSIRFAMLRKAGFPEKLAAIYNNRSEYLDRFCSRVFQRLQEKGWVELDGTGLIKILHDL